MKTVVTYLFWLTALMILALAWIGGQVAFPLVPIFAHVARQLPDSIQMLSVFAALTFSILGAFYFSYEWARQRIHRRSARTPHQICIEDPRFKESTVSNEVQ